MQEARKFKCTHTHVADMLLKTTYHPRLTVHVHPVKCSHLNSLQFFGVGYLFSLLLHGHICLVNQGPWFWERPNKQKKRRKGKNQNIMQQRYTKMVNLVCKQQRDKMQISCYEQTQDHASPIQETHLSDRHNTMCIVTTVHTHTWSNNHD